MNISGYGISEEEKFVYLQNRFGDVLVLTASILSGKHVGLPEGRPAKRFFNNLVADNNYALAA